jgi:nucleoside-diphosphate-sugar epimerase
VPVLGTSAHRYQLLGVEDLADGIHLLASQDNNGTFSFGARSFGTVRDDFNAFFARIGSRSTLRHVPPGLARASLRAIELAGMVPLSEWHRHSAWGRDSIADTTRAERELGWAPSQSNTDALVHAYNWFVATVRETGDAPRTHPLPHTHRILRGVLFLLPRS